MKTLSCRDAGCDCDYVAKGETEEDVLRDAAQHEEHGIKEHGKTDKDMMIKRRIISKHLFATPNHSLAVN